MNALLIRTVAACFLPVSMLALSANILGKAPAAKASLVDSSAQAPDPSDPWRFGNVKEWRYTIDIEAKDEVNKKTQDTEELSQANISGRVVVKLTKLNVNEEEIYFSSGDQSEWPSTISHRLRTYFKEIQPDKVRWTDLVLEGSGPVTTGALPLTIHPEKGTYTVQRFNWMLNKGSMSATSSDGPAVKQPMPMGLPFNVAKMMGDERPLPKSGMVIEGSDTFDWSQDPFSSSGQAGKTLKVTYRWTLMPWSDDAGDPKLEIDPKWLPEDSKTASPKCTWKGVASEVKFTLYDISSEPGTCMNSSSRSDEKDLEIMKGAGYEISAVDGGWMATAKVAGEEQAQLPIICHDYAARGKLKCEVKINGKWEKAKAGSKEYLSLPIDDNENKIADAWETEKGVKGLDASDDSEKSAGNTNFGDGYTLYEEYRGLMVKGKHKRMDPKRKELFVVNMVGGEVDKGIALFEKGADVVVLQGFRTEMDAGRIVNINKPSVGKGGDQHGLMIMTGDAMGGAGLTVPAKDGATYTPSPGAVTQINISVDYNQFGAEAAAKDVCHELGHACGLRHHGDAGSVRLDSDIYVADGSIVIKSTHTNWSIYDAKGALITARPFRLPAGTKIGFAKDTPASGDVGCVMCYDSVFSFSYKADGASKVLVNKPDIKPGTTFCTSPAGTKYNAPSHKPYSVFGNAQAGRGNCRSKIKLKDW